MSNNVDNAAANSWTSLLRRLPILPEPRTLRYVQAVRKAGLRIGPGI